MNKKILAVSFEGVINHGVYECCVVSLNAYHRISKESFFRRHMKPKEIELMKNTLVVRGFVLFRPLVSRAEDYFLVLKMIEGDVDGIYELLVSESRDKFETFLRRFEILKRETPENILRNFHENFYRERRRLRERNPEAWLTLQKPIEENINELRKLSKKFVIYVTTNKDKETCLLLLRRYGVDFVKETNVLPKEDGDIKDKIGLILKRENVTPEKIFLIDDIFHRDLAEIKNRGVNVFLIRGGYSFPWDVERAEANGIGILERGNFVNGLI